MSETRAHSLRFRFAVASLLWVGIITLLAGVAISELYSRHVTHTFTAELNNHLDELVALTVTPGGNGPILDRPLSDPRFERAGSGFYWQVENDRQAVLVSRSLGRRHLTAVRPPVLLPPFWTDADGEQLLRLDRIDRRGLRFSITASGRVLERELDAFRYDLALSLLAFAGLMLAGISFQVQYGLKPVRRLAEWIEQLRRGRIERLPNEVPREFSDVVGRLNELLEAQSVLVSRARVEAGNLGHNLRTPLALVAGEAEALAETGQAAAAQFILEQCARMQRQIDYHMKRAAAAGTRGAGVVADLQEFVMPIAGAMRRLHADRAIDIDIGIEPDFDVRCDPGDLAEMISNLIDNACKWASSSVRIMAERLPGKTIITVDDDGPGINPAQRLSVLDIGVRLDDTKPGTGLGLPISSDLVHLYGGTLVLETAPKLHGLRARLEVPA